MIGTAGTSPVGCGTIDGIVSYTIGGRVVMRSRSRPPPGSFRQQRIARIFAGLGMQWSIGLSTAQRDSWDAFAAAIGEVSGGCSPRVKNGYQWFLGTNIPRSNLFAAGTTSLPRVLTAPALAARPPAPASVSTASVSSGVFSLGGSLDGDAVGNFRVLVYVSSPLDAGDSYVGDPWHLAFVASGVGGQPTFFGAVLQSEARDWLAAWRVGAGDRVRLKLRAFFLDGRFSRALRLVRTLT